MHRYLAAIFLVVWSGLTLPATSHAIPSQFGDTGLFSQPTSDTLNAGNICIGLWTNCSSSATGDAIITPVTITLGLGSFLEAYGSYPSLLFNGDEAQSGRGYANIGFKLRPIGSRSSAFKIAVDGQFRSSISDDAALDSLTDMVGRVILSYKPGRVGFHLSGGMSENESPAGVKYENQTMMGGGIEFYPTQRLRLLGEFETTSAKIERADATAEATAGFQYFLSPHLTLNIGVGVGFSETSPDWRTLIGFSSCQGVGTYQTPIVRDAPPPDEAKVETAPVKTIKVRTLTPLVPKITPAKAEPVSKFEVPVTPNAEEVVVNPGERLAMPAGGFAGALPVAAIGAVGYESAQGNVVALASVVTAPAAFGGASQLTPDGVSSAETSTSRPGKFGRTFALNENLLTDDGKIVGKKVVDDSKYRASFVTIKEEKDFFYAEFFHSYVQTLPVWIEGNARYDLSHKTARPLEDVSLKVFKTDGKVPPFKLHLGEESEVFSFYSLGVGDAQEQEILPQVITADAETVPLSSTEGKRPSVVAVEQETQAATLAVDAPASVQPLSTSVPAVLAEEVAGESPAAPVMTPNTVASPEMTDSSVVAATPVTAAVSSSASSASTSPVESNVASTSASDQSAAEPSTAIKGLPEGGGAKDGENIFLTVGKGIALAPVAIVAAPFVGAAYLADKILSSGTAPAATSPDNAAVQTADVTDADVTPQVSAPSEVVPLVANETESAGVTSTSALVATGTVLAGAGVVVAEANSSHTVTVSEPFTAAAVAAPLSSAPSQAPASTVSVAAPQGSSLAQAPAKSTSVSAPSSVAASGAPTATQTVVSPAESFSATAPAAAGTVPVAAASAAVAAPTGSAIVASPLAAPAPTQAPVTAVAVTAPQGSSLAEAPVKSASITAPSGAAASGAPASAQTVFTPSESLAATAPAAAGTVPMATASAAIAAPIGAAAVSAPLATAEQTQAPVTAVAVTAPQGSSLAEAPVKSTSITAPSGVATSGAPTSAQTVVAPAESFAATAPAAAGTVPVAAASAAVAAPTGAAAVADPFVAAAPTQAPATLAAFTAPQGSSLAEAPVKSASVTAPSGVATSGAPTSTQMMVAPAEPFAATAPAAAGTVPVAAASAAVAAPIKPAAVTDPLASATPTQAPASIATVTVPQGSILSQAPTKFTSVTAPSGAATIGAPTSAETVVIPAESFATTAPAAAGTVPMAAASAAVAAPTGAVAVSSPLLSAPSSAPATAAAVTTPQGSSFAVAPAKSASVTTPSGVATSGAPTSTQSVVAPSQPSAAKAPASAGTLPVAAASAAVAAPIKPAAVATPLASAPVQAPATASVVTVPHGSAVAKTPAAAAVVPAPATVATSSPPTAAQPVTVSNKVAPANVTFDKPVTAVVYRKFRLPGFTFGFDEWSLSEEGKRALAEVAESLRKETRWFFVRIDGYTDNVGSDEYNFNLGMRRAISAATYLVVNNGFDPNLMFIKSVGEAEPVATNENDEGRSLNRRIELLILVPKEGP